MIGRTLSHFRIVEKLGEGGMGVVYRAEDEKLRRQVALKVLPPELVGNEERRLRFLREARAAAAVSHTNIAHVYEVDEAEGVVFIAMELVEGKTLREVIAGRPMPIKDALRIATEIAEGLARAHQAKVIHRDLKPDNVIVGTDGHAKILDFGLAKLLEERAEAPDDAASKIDTISREMTREGKIFGTAAYMSPEQARGQKVDARSDIFSFGTTLYEMVTGKVPFEGKTNTDTLSSIIRDQQPPPSAQNVEVYPRLEELLTKCLEKDKTERYQHTDDLVVDLRKLRRTTDSGVQAVRTPSGPVAVAPSSGWTRLVGTGTRRTAIVATLAVLLIGGGVATWLLWPEPAGFKSGDRILVTDFENTTDRRELDTAIRDAFSFMFFDSTLVRAISREDLTSLVTTRGGAATLRIEYDLAEQLCKDGDCEGFLIGRIDPDGTAYRLESKIYRVGEERPTAVSVGVAGSEDDILFTIYNMALELRQALGETPQAIAATPPPTTRSILTYQVYTVGASLIVDDPEESILVTKHALELDPDFVDAYLLLADANWNLGEYRQSRKAAEEGYRRSSGLSKQARLGSEIYYLEASYQFDTELERLKTYRRLYPFSWGGPHFMGLLYNGIAYEDCVSAESPYRDAYQLLSIYNNLANMGGCLAKQGKVDEIERLAADFRRKGGSEYDVGRFLLWLPVIRGDPEGVLETIERLESEVGLTEADGISWRRNAFLLAGRLREAEGAAATAWRIAKKARDVEDLFWNRLLQTWLRARKTDRWAAPSPEDLKPARESMLYLPDFARYSVELQLEDELESMIVEHQEAEKSSTSRFVREEIQYALGCLALIRGEYERSVELLGPLARDSELLRRHWALARAYASLELWRESAAEYEEYLKKPREKWFNAPFMILDQYRLARIYERLGDTDRARNWYERFLEDWKDADADIPELIEAKKRLAALSEDEEAGIR